METAGAEQTSEIVEGFTTMNQRWMKRRIERSRARCTATEGHGSTRTEGNSERRQQLPADFSRIVEKQSPELRFDAKVE
jgi:hypothetical protein